MKKTKAFGIGKAVVCLAILTALSACSSRSSDSEEFKVKISPNQCENVFVLNYWRFFEVYKFEKGAVKKVRRGLHPKYPYVSMHSAVHHCSSDTVITAVNARKWGRTFVDMLGVYQKLGIKPSFHGLQIMDNRGRWRDIYIDEGPTNMVLYKENQVIFDTTRVRKISDQAHKEFLKKKIEANPLLDEEAKDIYRNIQVLIGGELVVYDFVKEKIVDRYPVAGTGKLIRYGDILHTTGYTGGPVPRVDLKNRDYQIIYNHWHWHQFEKHAINREGRMFMLLNCTARVKRPDKLKNNAVYEIIDGYPKELFAMEEKDTLEIMAFNDYLYVFTSYSETVIRYSLKTKQITRFRLPYKLLKGVNYIKDHFVIIYNPDGGSNLDNYWVTVSDVEFKNFSNSVSVTGPVTTTSTQYLNAGGQILDGPTEYKYKNSAPPRVRRLDKK